jgi:hypothetical protein
VGYYIEVPEHHGKAEQLVELYGAKLLDCQPPWDEFSDLAIIVVCDNGLFEAAGYAYDEAEFAAFTDPSDTRPKQFLVMPRDQAEQLTGRAKRNR